MAVITDRAEPALVDKAVSTKAVPSYMRPTKTSARRQEPVLPKSGALKPKNLNSVRPASNGLQALKSATKVPAPKQDKQAESEALAIIKSGPKAQSKTKTRGLGNLFTDGGLSETLIKVISFLGNNELAPCLQVCKNSNAVMVNTAEIQVSLRAHLYGIKRLPQNQLKWLKSATEHNSRQLISEFANKQRHIELDTYVATGDSPYVLPGRPRIVGMHDDAVIHMTGSNPERCCLTRQTEYTLIDRVFPSASTFIGCPEDSVVVEAYGCEGSVHQLSRKQTEFNTYLRFISDAPGLGPGPTEGVDHPDARNATISITTEVGDGLSKKLEDVKIRLHSGGLIAVLLIKAHDCSSCQSVGTNPSSTSIMMFDWHHGKFVGGLNVPESCHMIMDFQFLSASQIACSVQRKVKGSAFPCIDIYDIPRSGPAASTDLVDDPNSDLKISALAPELRLVASLQLPRLKLARIGCVWSQKNRYSNSISDFDLRIPRISNDVPSCAQVITFRLAGQAGRDGVEILQGVILISKLQAIVQKEAANKSKELNAAVNFKRCEDDQELDPAISEVALTNGIYPGRYPGQLGYEPICFEWGHWSSATSIHQSKSSSVHDSRGTQVANVARSRLDRANAVMVIRDYSQQLVFAPLGHTSRNLGHPTKNADSDDSIPPRHTSAETFKAAVRHEPLICRLFGRDVSGGLGYRERKVELGQYGPNTAWSTLFWQDEKTLSIANHDPDGPTTLHYYERLLPPAQRL